MGYGWEPYVTVAERREKAQRKIDKLRKQGLQPQPVEIEGQKITRTFWGQSWCKHLESFSDYESRLPRGRSYVRNGSVCHLEIAAGNVKAMVSGSELYEVKIVITKLPEKKWNAVKDRCSGQIGSLLELLQGRLSSSVMTVVTDRNEGLFPKPTEIKLDCSCPDWAVMCKHVAAVLYGVGARLDEKPDLLFLLRGVDHEELIEADVTIAASGVGSKRGGRRLDEADLGDMFGIEMVADESSKNGRRKSKPDLQATKETEPRPSGQRKRVDVIVDTVSPATTKQTFSQPTSASVKKKTSSQTITPAVNKATSNQIITRKTKVTTTKIVIVPQSPSVPAANATEKFQTSKSVRELRSRLDLSQNELAQLIGVSLKSVITWEKKRGYLNLQRRTMIALTAAEKLTKKEAIRQLAND